ncbi:MAG: MBL fold metallo-hydrolase [Gammaproteobacteria bacterium]|nr:MBL fold metallo-hydrolase [Gammaproteobacteria bacterium]
MNEVWQVGGVKISRVVEMEVTGGSRFILPDATRDACRGYRWMFPHFMDDAGNLVMSIHALVVDTGERRIVVDTCIGNDKDRDIPTWSHLQTSFLADLEAAGYPRESIDTVLCTHLHVDHVGWNTMLVDGEWLPTFPNARYLVGETEWRYWDDRTTSAQVLADSVRPVIDAGLVDFVPVDHQVCDEVWLEPTPGHTPGHVSVRISSGGEDALITGDCIHHPCQMTRTDWCSSADTDQAQGLKTRESLLERMVDTDVLVIGTHFATPTAGHVKRRDAGGYWLQV